MNHPPEHVETSLAAAAFPSDDGFDVLDGFVAAQNLDDAELYQEIAERRAQLECAETLRRGRAL